MIARTGVRAIVSVAMGLSLLIGGASAASALPAREAAPSARPMEQQYFWEWSDGYEKMSRTFKESDYGSQGLLPHIVVTVEPATPKRTVTLKYYEDGGWRLEGTKKTNSAGKASLDFNPWCNAAHTNWCDGSWKYKLAIGGVAKNFTIKFSSK